MTLTSNTPTRIRRAFTLVELLVVIGIIGLLVAILLPTLSMVRSSARSATCLSNLRSLGQVALVYSNDNKQFVLPNRIGDDRKYDFWPNLLIANELLEPQQEGREIPGPANDGLVPGIDYDSIVVCPSTADIAMGVARTADGARRVNGDFLLNPNGARKATDFSYFINGFYVDNQDAWRNPDSQPYERAERIPSTQISYGSDIFPPLKRLPAIRSASEIVYFGDGTDVEQQSIFQVRIAVRVSGKRHGDWDDAEPETTGKTNLTFFDGHAESVDRNLLPHGEIAKEFPVDNAMTQRARDLNTAFPGAKFRLDQVNP